MKNMIMYEAGDYMIDGEDTYTCTDVKPVKNEAKVIIKVVYTFEKMNPPKESHCIDPTCKNKSDYYTYTNSEDLSCALCGKEYILVDKDKQILDEVLPTRQVDTDADELIGEIRHYLAFAKDPMAYNMLLKVVEFVRKNHQ